MFWLSLGLVVGVLTTLEVKSQVNTGGFIYYDSLNGQPYTVTADERSFIINGERTLFLGGSIHYPRFSPGQWGDVLSKVRADGLNHVQIYVFWNIHEFTYDFSGNHVYDFTGRANLPQFLDECAKAGLFVDLRIGPYVCAEWDFGGLPVWLLHVDGIEYRCNNDAWENEMGTFVKNLSPYVEPYLAKNGGPIAMAQIENEYHGPMDYVDWCGDLAISLNYSIPWVMCNGESAPQTINTCNADNCYQYAQSHAQYYPNQLLGWTEDWGFFQTWENYYSPTLMDRTPEDQSYVVCVWFGAGGAHHNYYMYIGGNHIDHWAGSGVTNFYSDGCVWHADALPNEPKHNHVVKLHNILAQNQYALLTNDAQIGNEIPVSGQTIAYLYKDATNTSGTIQFLCNNGGSNEQVTYNSQTYQMQNYSCKILDANGNILYDTAVVDSDNLPTKRVYTTLFSGSSDLQWKSWSEEFPLTNNPQSRTDKPYKNLTPLEQLRFANESSEYLYYSTTFELLDGITSIGALEWNGRMANAYLVFINNEFISQVFDYSHNAGDRQFNIPLGQHHFDQNTNYTLTIVSSSQGIDNYYGVNVCGTSDKQDAKGIIDSVLLQGNINQDLSSNTWTHWIGSTGENLMAGNANNNIQWQTLDTTNAKTWYRTEFVITDDSILSEGTILIDIGANGMYRGHLWLNSKNLGHYNNATIGSNVVQQYYFIPNDWLNIGSTTTNVLIFEEENVNVNPMMVNIVVSNVVVPN